MNIRNEYPRPNLVRKHWQPLNGVWQFAFDDDNVGLQKGYFDNNYPLNKAINVPFSYQTEASGINETAHHEILWYKKKFRLEKQLKNKTVLLNFNAVDFEATVWVNGIFVAFHTNGYSAFSVDITSALKEGENEITVRVKDSQDTWQPRGKQTWNHGPFKCWYHATSGIWQSVWLEATGADYITNLKTTTDIDKNQVILDIETTGIADYVTTSIYYQNKLVKRVTTLLEGKITRQAIDMLAHDSVDEVHMWSPDQPNLYQMALQLFKKDHLVDEVATYFGFRKIQVDEVGNICLNNRPIYQKLILDQGYWAQSGLTPPSIEALKHDIEISKQMGFNGGRKHQKVEDPYYYYYADVLGYLVWAELPSGYCYNYREVQYISAHLQEMVLQLYNHPSIIVWVPLNESWGVRKMLVDAQQQDFARSLYYLIKSIDNTRLVDTNDGWENILETDFYSIHDYSKYGDDFAKLANINNIEHSYPMNRKTVIGNIVDRSKPVLITEFGGVSINEYMKNDHDWGYAGSESLEDFYDRFKKLMTHIKQSPIKGYCYTQLSDVMQETNGLLDEMHQPKVSVKIIRDILDE